MRYFLILFLGISLLPNSTFGQDEAVIKKKALLNVKLKLADIEYQFIQRQLMTDNLLKVIPSESSKSIRKSYHKNVGSFKAKQELLNSNFSKRNIKKFMHTISKFEVINSNIIKRIEKDDELKSSQILKDVVFQLLGSKNRLDFAKQNYNDTVESYDKLLKLPTFTL